MKIPEDIQRIADTDPVMQELLKQRALFFFKDWQLFRAQNKEELIARLSKRANRAAIVFLVVVIIYAILLVVSLSIDPAGVSLKMWGLRAVLLLGYGTATLQSLRKRRQLLALQAGTVAGEFPAE